METWFAKKQRGRRGRACRASERRATRGATLVLGRCLDTGEATSRLVAGSSESGSPGLPGTIQQGDEEG